MIMTQLGEAVEVADFVNDVHTESTCPWHQEGPKNKKKMAALDPDDDIETMPPNDGGTLGRNLTSAEKPKADSLLIKYAPGEVLTYEVGKKKKVIAAQSYEATLSGEEYEYDLQYAPHHLIPGNESLKGSELIAWMGDSDSISEFAGKRTSRIKEGFSIGYDVNAAANGVWLPSPYALSMQNKWPAKPAILVTKKRKRAGVAAEMEDFKIAYVAASIAASGGRQFHMRHLKYSDKVVEILKTIAQRLSLMADGACPLVASSNDADKFDPPAGLVARLDVLSANLSRLLTGTVWRPPLFADAMTEEYAKDLAKATTATPVDKVV
jgi:hypothetical protein